MRRRFDRSRLAFFILTIITRVPSVLSHIELAYPPAIKSTHDPQTAEPDKDYSMTSPLEADGSNYPAKGYATKEAFDKLKPVATLVAGQDFTWKTAGTATHDGGSCQVGISYDLLKTVAVMASYVGGKFSLSSIFLNERVVRSLTILDCGEKGCPLQKDYKFKVPDIPGAEKALFWWSWFNKSGNREMYNNVAVVAVSGKAKSFKGPVPFRANTFADGSCITTEGKEWLFPNPGDQVFFGGEYEGKSPAPGGKIDGCSWDVESDVTVTSDGSSATAPSKEDKSKDEKPKGAKSEEDGPDDKPKATDAATSDDVGADATTAKTTGTAATSKPNPKGASTTGPSPTDGADNNAASDPLMTENLARTAVETDAATTSGAGTTFTPKPSLADPASLSTAQILGGLLIGVLVLALLGVMFALMMHHSQARRPRRERNDEETYLVKRRPSKSSRRKRYRTRSRSRHSDDEDSRTSSDDKRSRRRSSRHRSKKEHRRKTDIESSDSTG
ncbi:hypothetical protein OIV83_002484 [Microbotryomycetes sp. JL201]|nr:hypothetical protein OIV83_002484 [Microbotryomycetes sp. JL201]